MTEYVFKRVEKKFLLTAPQYDTVLDEIGKHMREDAYGVYSISNVYFDTDDYTLARRSVEKPGPVYKEKLRLRSYGVPGPDDQVFLELKKKFDGVVYKRRVSMTLSEAQNYFRSGARPRGDGQILREIDYFRAFYNVSPKVFIAYERRAYAGIRSPDLRITFDTNIRWRTDLLTLGKDSHGERLLPPDVTVMEIKIPGAAPLWLAGLLSRNGIFHGSFSKYGAVYTNHLMNDLHFLKIGADICA